MKRNLRFAPNKEGIDGGIEKLVGTFLKFLLRDPRDTQAPSLHQGDHLSFQFHTQSPG
jgi:hypothetical protein